jgi:hypothetical protein
MKIHDGGRAFPRPASEDTGRGTCSDGNRAEDAQDGMSLLDWFAGMALQGDMASCEPGHQITNHASFARTAYKIAAAMVAERTRIIKEGL